MKGGKWFQDQMVAGVKESDFLIFMVSKSSLESNAVGVEWKTKFSDKITKGEDTVFPFVIDSTAFEELPDYLQKIYSYRYDENKDNVLKIVDDIKFWKAEKGA